MKVKDFAESLDRQQTTALAAALGGKTVYHLKKKLIEDAESFKLSDAKAIISYAKEIGVILDFKDFFQE